MASLMVERDGLHTFSSHGTRKFFVLFIFLVRGNAPETNRFWKWGVSMAGGEMHKYREIRKQTVELD